MKKEVIETRIGEFTDYLGNTRKYMIAAISEMLPMADEDNDAIYHTVNCSCNCGDYCEGVVVKQLSIGFAITNAHDKFNEKIGREIAIGKARKRPHAVLYASIPGIINSPVVEAILKQEMNHFEENPGSVIAGYNTARDKYLAEHAENK